MWNRIKHWLGASEHSAERTPEDETVHQFKWYDPGDENPFGLRMLDVRSLTWTSLAVTSDIRVAESFGVQRQTDGREFIDAKIENARTIACNLVFPYHGERLEGVAFKADCMEDKWDIYAYDLVFLFVDSWRGQLRYRASAEVGQDKVVIHTVETSADNIDTAPQAVYFLLATHALGRTMPHTIPRDTPNDPLQIALKSLSMYGRRACFATFEDVTQIALIRPDEHK